jgi:DNA-binding transcriptional LysR family regulator
MRIKLRQLESFLAVCKYMHFTEAAASLSFTQPALSYEIAQLEKAVGVKLIERAAGRKFWITERGEEFAKRAAWIVNAAIDLEKGKGF